MCSRYFVTNPLAGTDGGRWELRPGDRADVLTAGPDGRPVRQVQIWGFSDVPQLGTVFNARSESALQKRLFQDSLLKRRCVVLASGFYEWNQAKEKAVFEHLDGRMLYFAGFFDYRGQDFAIPRFVILTTEANDSMKSIHDRMPLLLREEQIEDWLFKGELLEQFLKQKPFELKREMDYEQQTFEFLL